MGTSARSLLCRTSRSGIGLADYFRAHYGEDEMVFVERAIRAEMCMGHCGVIEE